MNKTEHNTYYNMKRILSILTLTLMCVGLQAQSFTHPGLLHTKHDIERMKTYVAAKEEPTEPREPTR